MSAVRTHAAFENNFVSILDKNAPKKTKILRGNQKPHPNMNLRKQILIRLRLLLALSRSQPAFTCSKLTIETLEQGVKYVQS